MTADLVSAASLIMMFVVMCAVIKMYFAFMSIQPRVERLAHVRDRQPGAVINVEQPRYGTVRRRGRRRRPRPQEHDERYY